MQQSLFASMISQPETAAVSSDLNVPLSEAVFTVIDLETTGLSSKKNAITEVVAIQYKNGVELAKYSTLVKPSEPIPPEAEAITGISNDMVQNAPALISVLPELCSFIGSSPVLVGHNVSFDIRFLQEKIQQQGFSSFLDRFQLSRSLCTKALAVKVVPGLPSYEGIVVATHCNVNNPNPHRAEHDVRMCAGILYSLIDKLTAQDPSIKTVQDLLTYQGPLSA